MDGACHNNPSSGHRDHERFDQLDEHLRALLPLIARGDPNREIAQILVLEVHTVENHVSEIMEPDRLSPPIQAPGRGGRVAEGARVRRFLHFRGRARTLGC